MCGIFAYLNYNVNRERRYILQVLFNGLRRLEYRGYDSAGISIDNDFSFSHDPSTSQSSFSPSLSPPPLVFRQEGNIESLVRYVYQDVAATELNLEESFSIHAGIAHTRWATHGEPAPRNSHPQTSGPGNDFLVVHNGVITNYEVLKETLVRHGFTFESETDTEVIPKLAKFVFDKANEEGFHCQTLSKKDIITTQFEEVSTEKITGVLQMSWKQGEFDREEIEKLRNLLKILEKPTVVCSLGKVSSSGLEFGEEDWTC